MKRDKRPLCRQNIVTAVVGFVLHRRGRRCRMARVHDAGTVMGQPAARLTDMHVCPLWDGMVPHVGGPVFSPGCPTVLVGGLPAARVGDEAVCCGPFDVIVEGSPTVLIGGSLAARLGDMTAHGGMIVMGCPTVLIGDGAG